jgi:hypothetical protein
MRRVIMRGVSELDDLLAALAADADVVIKHDRIAQAARDRIRARLPEAYARGAGITELERTIKQLYVQRSISRIVTGQPAETSRPRRKRAGAAPDEPSSSRPGS